MHKGVVFAIGLIALAAGYFASSIGTPQQHGVVNENADYASVFVYPQARPLATVELTDMHGNPITANTFSNSWWVVYFGFTYCPDACPMALAHMKQVKDLLPTDSNIRFALVSVDPERDQPETLRQYVTHFDPDFYAATGSKEQLDLLTESLNVVYVIEPHNETQQDYAVDHSNFMVLINPDGQHAGIISAPHDPQAIAKDLSQIIAADSS